MKKFVRVCLSLDSDTDCLLECLADSCNMSKSEFVKSLITGKLQIKYYRSGCCDCHDIYENFQYSERYNA